MSYSLTPAQGFLSRASNTAMPRTVRQRPTDYSAVVPVNLVSIPALRGTKDGGQISLRSSWRVCWSATRTLFSKGGTSQRAPPHTNTDT